MGEVIDLMEALRKSLSQVPPPEGVDTPPKFVLDEDSTDAPAVWVSFRINERKAKPEALLKFTREVESAAAQAAPNLVTYVRFRASQLRKRAQSTR